jgi:hypothetical protein
VYSRVNLVYFGNQGRLEYDFVVAPGANAASQIAHPARNDSTAHCILLGSEMRIS